VGIARFFPQGLGQWFCPLDGALLVIAIKQEFVPGHSFTEKAQQFDELEVTELSKLVKDHGMVQHIELGDLCWVPAGWLLYAVPLSNSPAAWLRWASFDEKVDPNGAEFKKVLSASASMQSSFPALQATNKPWMQFLEAATKAPKPS